jgi:ribosomal protein S18 acetylase RimI-like enzyme
VISVRRAQVEDAFGIAACLEAAFEPFRSQYTRDAFDDTVLRPKAIRERMQHMTVYAASTPDGEIVGTLASAMEGKEAHLRGMAVRPEWQGSGIAQRLLVTAQGTLVKAGCTRVTLDTTQPLQAAIGFYRRNGFTPSGRVSDFFGMPLYEYEKRLDAAHFVSSVPGL